LRCVLRSECIFNMFVGDGRDFLRVEGWLALASGNEGNGVIAMKSSLDTITITITTTPWLEATKARGVYISACPLARKMPTLDAAQHECAA
jgi:hypothetical protein